MKHSLRLAVTCCAALAVLAASLVLGSALALQHHQQQQQQHQHDHQQPSTIGGGGGADQVDHEHLDEHQQQQHQEHSQSNIQPQVISPTTANSQIGHFEKSAPRAALPDFEHESFIGGSGGGASGASISSGNGNAGSQVHSSSVDHLHDQHQQQQQQQHVQNFGDTALSSRKQTSHDMDQSQRHQEQEHYHQQQQQPSPVKNTPQAHQQQQQQQQPHQQQQQSQGQQSQLSPAPQVEQQQSSMMQHQVEVGKQPQQITQQANSHSVEQIQPQQQQQLHMQQQPPYQQQVDQLRQKVGQKSEGQQPQVSNPNIQYQSVNQIGGSGGGGNHIASPSQHDKQQQQRIQQQPQQAQQSAVHVRQHQQQQDQSTSNAQHPQTQTQVAVGGFQSAMQPASSTKYHPPLAASFSSSPLYDGHNPFIEILRPHSYADDNIVTLNLSHSHIYEIDSDAFVGQRFEHIDLSNNKLGLVHSRSFRIGPIHSRHQPYDPRANLTKGQVTGYPTRRRPPPTPKSVTIDFSHNPAIVALSGAFDHIDVPNCLLNFTNSTVELKFGAFKKYFKDHPGHLVDIELVDCCDQEWLLGYKHNFVPKTRCAHDPNLFLLKNPQQTIIDSCIAYVTSARHSMTMPGSGIIQSAASSPRHHSNSHVDNQYLTYLILGGTAMILTSLSIYIIFYMFSLKAAFVYQMQTQKI